VKSRQDSMLGATPSQTVGPYFSMCLGAKGQNVLVDDTVTGERMRIEGHVFDGDGKPIEDALLELWQADARGRYAHPSDAGIEPPYRFGGFGRASTDYGSGAYWFETIRPGPVPDDVGTLQAPHLNLIVQARGMLLPSFTRIYFSDCMTENERDRVWNLVPAQRRHTLLATRFLEAPLTFRFNIRFQGGSETVFFDY
jgi:protocatechuate 3,4-dioxygenase, alpha subunit